MKKIFILIILISAGLLLANPIVPVFISEFSFDGDNWILEIYDYYQDFELYDLDGCYLLSSIDSTAFNNGITFNQNGVFVVDENDVQSPFSYNQAGDTIIFANVELYYYDEISFGEIVNPPLPDQSLARIVLCSDMPPFGDIYFLLAKENQPTLGSAPFTLSTSGIFMGYVYDSLMNPVPNVDIDMTPDLGIDYAYIETDYTGYFSTSLPGMNYEFNIHLAALASLDTLITIEPDSVHYFEFIFENYVVGVDEPEVIIPSQDYQLSNHPNPFNPSTTISFSVTQTSSFVTIEIYNSKGQKVDELSIHNGQSVSAGLKSSITWEANNFPSGVYLYRLIVGGKEVASNKMLLLK